MLILAPFPRSGGEGCLDDKFPFEQLVAHSLHSQCNWSDFKGFLLIAFNIIRFGQKGSSDLENLLFCVVTIFSLLVFALLISVIECCTAVNYIDFPSNDFLIIRLFANFLSFVFFLYFCVREVFCGANKWPMRERERFGQNFFFNI